QHLFRELEAKGERYLTVRADTPKLFQRSKEIADAVAGLPVRGKDAQRGRDSLRNRILWLAELLYTTLPEPEDARRRTWMRIALGSATAMFLLSLGVGSAIRYHPVYEARIKDAEARAAAERQREEGEAHGGATAPTPTQVGP